MPAFRLAPVLLLAFALAMPATATAQRGTEAPEPTAAPDTAGTVESDSSSPAPAAAVGGGGGAAPGGAADGGGTAVGGPGAGPFVSAGLFVAGVGVGAVGMRIVGGRRHREAGASTNYNSAKSNTAGIRAGGPQVDRDPGASTNYNSAKSNTAGLAEFGGQEVDAQEKAWRPKDPKADGPHRDVKPGLAASNPGPGADSDPGASTNYNSAKSNTAGIVRSFDGPAGLPAMAPAQPGPDLEQDPPVQGDPIPGVDVSIEQSPGGIIIAVQQTNTAGTYRFSGLAPGTYVLRAGPAPGRKVTVRNGTVSGLVASTGIFATAAGAGPAR